jgi:hypothetical protein
MIFYNDFIQRVNLIGLPIHCDTASRFTISRLRRVFARALPDPRTVSTTVPGYRTGALIRRIPDAFPHDSRPASGRPKISCYDGQSAGLKHIRWGLSEYRYAYNTREEKNCPPGSIKNQKDETRKWDRYECTYCYSTRVAKNHLRQSMEKR